MMNKSCSVKKILALVLALITLLPCAPALAESYLALVSDDGLAVYADAQFDRKLAELDAYTPVKVTGVKGEVARISYEGYTVYAEKDGLTSAAEIAIPGVAKQDTRVFEEPDLLSRSAALKKGVQLNVLAVNGDWAMVEKDGNVAYAYVEHLTPAAAEEEEEESTEDPFLPEEDNQEGSQGGADAEGVTIQTVAAKVSAAKLPVYKSASTDSKLLGTLKKGQAVTVYAYNSDWAYIGLNGKYGFCALEGLEKTSGEEPEENDEPVVDLSNAIPATVTADSVKVYASASTDSDTLGTLKKGAQVNVVKAKGDWAFIELKGKLGYCAVAALTRTSDLENSENTTDEEEVIGGKDPLGTATVIAASAPVYNSRKATNPSFTLKMGETVSYYGYDSKWVLVGRDGSFGFVQKKYLSADSYAELDTDDTGSAVNELEKKLLALGYLDSIPGTTYTAYTAEAVSRLQAACGMSQTGRADIAVLRVLFSGNAPASPLLSLNLSKGSTDSVNVRRIQTRLLSLGYLSKNSSVDGDYGSTTANAVKLFQTAAGASSTGTADSATIKALYSASAPTLPSGSTAADAVTVNTGSGASGNSSSISSDLASTTSQLVAGMSNAKKLEYVIYIAQQQLGKPYVFGSAGTSSFDCSGFTMYCFKQVGVNLRHSAYSEGYNNNFTKISSKSSLRRGDLVFFNTISDGDQCDHVGIYLGSDYFIHASSGAGKIVVSGMGSGYYSRVYSWGRRILET